MKRASYFVFPLLILLATVLDGYGQGTAFTYQGRLADGGGTANGIYDLRFTIYAVPVGGSAVGGLVTNAATLVSNGLFTVTVDVGAGVFNGVNRWLEIGVRTNGSVSDFTPVSPRQPITATPYAIFSSASGSLSNGVIQNPQFLGSTDSTPLDFFAGSQRALRLQANVNLGAPNIIAGAAVNEATPGVYGATIAGGGVSDYFGESYSNRVGNHFATVGGGVGNFAQGFGSVISGGIFNTVQGYGAVVGGGDGNTNGASAAVVSGGRNNWIEPLCDLSVIGGGWLNFIQGGADQSVIAGGNAGKIRAGARESFIGGGFDNIIQTNASGSFIGGGTGNRIGDNSGAGTIAGGSANAISNNAAGATISGGFDNTAAQRHATVGGGYQNFASGNFNVPNGDSATVAGGYQNAAVGNNAVVAGGYANYARGDNSAIAGGWLHTNLTGFGFIGGGQQQLIEPFSQFSVIAGGDNNRIRSNSTHAVIAGGQSNSVGTNAPYATIAGGTGNAAAGAYAFAAGRRAKANHQGTFVWADSTNTDFASSSSNQFLIRASGGVGIGVTNPAAALEVMGTVRASAFEGGNAPLMFNTTGNQPLEFKVNGARALRLEPTAGSPNVIGGFSGNYVSNSIVGATIAGGGANGSSNAISANYSAVGGGFGNVIEKDSVNTAIGGGRQNRIGTSAYTATIGGGDRNVIEAGAFSATIAGGGFNDIQVDAQGATIGGGGQNSVGINADYSVIAGGAINTNLGYASAVGGGANNRNMGANYGVISGGADNTAQTNSTYAVISGGRLNQIGVQTFACSILSGYNNVVLSYAESSVIGGGRQNQIDPFSTHASVLGGSNNLAHGNFSSVGGGLRNQATGTASTVPGGSDNSAFGDYSFAGGRRATANNQGCFVWADSQDAPFDSTTDNQFLVRANFTGINRATPVTGSEYFGVRAPVTNSYGGMYMETAGVGLPFYGYAMAGSGYAWTYLDGTDGNKWKLNHGGDRITVTTGGNVGINNNSPTERLHVIGNILATGTITPNSDRNAKTDFAAVDTSAVLERVAKLPIQQWRFKAEAENVKHVGPMAQDFRAAFGLGAHETAIATVDADGVALAAIQGLHQMVKDKDAKIAALEDRLAKVEQLLSSLTISTDK